MIRVRERLKVVIPITLVLIWLLMYMNTKSAMKTFIVLLAVPFSIIGAVWFLWILGYNMSIAVWVGIIALMGLDAETGVFMLLFLDLSYDEAKAKGLLRNRAELIEAIIHGAVKRVRPKAMTVFAAMLGLMPIMWSVGAGSDVMKRIAAPMVGGLVTSFALELLVYPAIYMLWKQRQLPGIRRPAPGDGFEGRREREVASSRESARRGLARGIRPLTCRNPAPSFVCMGRVRASRSEGPSEAQPSHRRRYDDEIPDYGRTGTGRGEGRRRRSS